MLLSPWDWCVCGVWGQEDPRAPLARQPEQILELQRPGFKKKPQCAEQLKKTVWPPRSGVLALRHTHTTQPNTQHTHTKLELL